MDTELRSGCLDVWGVAGGLAVGLGHQTLGLRLGHAGDECLEQAGAAALLGSLSAVVLASLPWRQDSSGLAIVGYLGFAPPAGVDTEEATVSVVGAHCASLPSIGAPVEGSRAVMFFIARS